MYNFSFLWSRVHGDRFQNTASCTWSYLKTERWHVNVKLWNFRFCLQQRSCLQVATFLGLFYVVPPDRMAVWESHRQNSSANMLTAYSRENPACLEWIKRFTEEFFKASSNAWESHVPVKSVIPDDFTCLFIRLMDIVASWLLEKFRFWSV